MTLRLNLYETQSLWPLTDHAAGVYTDDIYAECDTLVVALFISTIDPGATLTIDITEAVIGATEGESESLGTTGATAVVGHKRFAVRGFLCRPIFKATVTGGRVRFGVMVSAKQNIPGVGAGTTDFASLITDGANTTPDINVNVTPTGLRVAGRVSEVLLSTIDWTALPPGGALDNRNAINIQNYSGDEIRLNYNPGVAGFSGIILNDQSERNLDIKDTIQVYAKAKTGGSTIIIEEIS